MNHELPISVLAGGHPAEPFAARKPYLRPIGPTPQIIAPKSGRNPRKFQTGCVAYCCKADGKPRSFIRAPKAAERWTVKNPPEAKI
jgi:hypothetical protein